MYLVIRVDEWGEQLPMRLFEELGTARLYCSEEFAYHNMNGTNYEWHIWRESFPGFVYVEEWNYDYV